MRVLDPSHGVHGVHQGYPVPALELEPDITGEPVVGVDQIMIVQPCRQLRTELIDQLRKCFLGDVLRWSCLQVDHSGVLVHLDNVRHVGASRRVKTSTLRPRSPSRRASSAT